MRGPWADAGKPQLSSQRVSNTRERIFFQTCNRNTISRPTGGSADAALPHDSNEYSERADGWHILPLPHETVRFLSARSEDHTLRIVARIRNRPKVEPSRQSATGCSPKKNVVRCSMVIDKAESVTMFDNVSDAQQRLSLN